MMQLLLLLMVVVCCTLLNDPARQVYTLQFSLEGDMKLTAEEYYEFSHTDPILYANQPSKQYTLSPPYRSLSSK